LKLEGKEALSGSPEKIWAILMDAPTLAKITPGLSRLEQLDDENFEAIADVKMGPVKGQFKGDLKIADKVDKESFALHVNQKSKIGNVNAKVNLKLTPLENGETELSFEGKVNMSGLLARTGARVMTGVSNALTKQFFEALKNELSNS